MAKSVSITSKLEFSAERGTAIRAEIEQLMYAHWGEVRIFDDLFPEVSWEFYERGEDAGIICTFTARHLDKLVGYQTYTVHRHHHYNIMAATQNVLFLHPDHRKGTAGIRFIKFAERCLSGMGVELIMQHTKRMKDLSRLFGRLGYKETDMIMIKRL